MDDIRKRMLLVAWRSYKEDIINSMTDYSENDGFVENYDVSDEEFAWLCKQKLNLVIG